MTLKRCPSTLPSQHVNNFTTCLSRWDHCCSLPHITQALALNATPLSASNFTACLSGRGLCCPLIHVPLALLHNADLDTPLPRQFHSAATRLWTHTAPHSPLTPSLFIFSYIFFPVSTPPLRAETLTSPLLETTCTTKPLGIPPPQLTMPLHHLPAPGLFPFGFAWTSFPSLT